MQAETEGNAVLNKKTANRGERKLAGYICDVALHAVHSFFTIGLFCVGLDGIYFNEE